MTPLERVTAFFRRTALFWFIFLAVFATMYVKFQSEFPQLHLLCKWDCGWYESIARQGYRTPIPPLYQNSEESNVAFFPAYPFLSAGLSQILGIGLKSALPLVSILCAFFLSFLISSLLRNETKLSRKLRYAVLIVYPAVFYLFVSYSESLYLLSMLGVCTLLLLPDEERKSPASLFALVVLGILLGATRLTGFVIPSFLLLAATLFSFVPRFDRTQISRLLPPISPILGACVGTGAFFGYCAYRFGVWNLYFVQLKIGWYKTFDPIRAIFIAFHPPAGFEFSTQTFVENARTFSWLIVELLLVKIIYASIRAFPTAIRAHRERNWADFARCFLVWGAFAHLLIVVCGDVGPWDYWGNGMRYSMPTVFLLVLAWRDEWTPAFFRKKPGMILLGVVFGAALAYSYQMQLRYIVQFIRNVWVS